MQFSVCNNNNSPFVLHSSNIIKYRMKRAKATRKENVKGLLCFVAVIVPLCIVASFMVFYWIPRIIQMKKYNERSADSNINDECL